MSGSKWAFSSSVIWSVIFLVSDFHLSHLSSFIFGSVSLPASGVAGWEPPGLPSGVHAKRKNPVRTFFVEGSGGLGSHWWRTRPDPLEPSNPPVPLLPAWPVFPLTFLVQLGQFSQLYTSSILLLSSKIKSSWHHCYVTSCHMKNCSVSHRSRQAQAQMCQLGRLEFLKFWTLKQLTLDWFSAVWLNRFWSLFIGLHQTIDTDDNCCWQIMMAVIFVTESEAWSSSDSHYQWSTDVITDNMAYSRHQSDVICVQYCRLVMSCLIFCKTFLKLMMSLSWVS